MGEFSNFLYDLFGIKTMDDILVAGGIIITAVVAILCIAYHSEEKPWRNSILAFSPCFIAGWAFYNWPWWVALLVALGEAIAIRIVSPLFHSHSAPTEDERDLDAMLADLDHAIENSKAKKHTTIPTPDIPAAPTSSSPPQETHNTSPVSSSSPIVKSSPIELVPKELDNAEKKDNRVEQTLLSCLRCGRILSDPVCKNCGYDHTNKVLLLNRIAPRDLQLSK